MPLQSVTRKKTYSSPNLNKPTREQANLILIGHASCRDQGAKDLLEVLYPPDQAREEPQCSPNLHIPVTNSEQKPVYGRKSVPARYSLGQILLSVIVAAAHWVSGRAGWHWWAQLAERRR